MPFLQHAEDHLDKTCWIEVGLLFVEDHISRWVRLETKDIIFAVEHMPPASHVEGGDAAKGPDVGGSTVAFKVVEHLGTDVDRRLWDSANMVGVLDFPG